MSHIIRTGRLLSAEPLYDTPGEEYVYVQIEVFDKFWDDTGSNIDTSATYTVMVFGQAAVQTSALAEAGHRPSIVFSGRYLVRGFEDESGARRISHEVMSEYVGINLNDPLLSQLGPKPGHGPDPAAP